jgi:hypothetical protein
MNKTSTVNNSTTLKQLEKEMIDLRKKLFIFETLQAENEIKKGKAKGPFKNGKELIENIKA